MQQPLADMLASHGLAGTITPFWETLGGTAYRLDQTQMPVATCWRACRDLFAQTHYWPLIYDMSLYGNIQPYIPTKPTADPSSDHDMSDLIDVTLRSFQGMEHLIPELKRWSKTAGFAETIEAFQDRQKIAETFENVNEKTRERAIQSWPSHDDMLTEIIEEGLGIDPVVYLGSEIGDMPYPDEAWIAEQIAASEAQARSDGEDLDTFWAHSSSPAEHLSTLGGEAIVLLPAQESWHVPAILNYPRGVMHPDSTVHVCLLKRWYELYGAETVIATGTTRILHATRPPQNRTAALTLAWENQAYCIDVGLNETYEYARALLHNTVWTFWWD